MIERADRHAELHFASLCTASGAACNESKDDLHGWDYIVEIPPTRNPNRLPDKQPRIITALVQIKSTTKNRLITRIKLSNALKAIQSDLPCFIFMFSYNDDQIKIFGKHVWSEFSEIVLKKARQSEIHGSNSLHKKSISVLFEPSDEIQSSEIAQWIQRTVNEIGEDYASKKIRIRDKCGYEKRRYIVKFTLGPLD
ncbi:MAG: DUF4365 domain-containing protein, partial [Gammaproteobacteria bacterium]|nr:DUF4365 domain-containing protein [Gammaproteobacteria bacterium]